MKIDRFLYTMIAIAVLLIAAINKISTYEDNRLRARIELLESVCIKNKEQ